MHIYLNKNSTIYLYTNLTLILSVTSVRAGGHRKPFDQIKAKNNVFLFIAGLGQYMRQSTDTAGNSTIAEVYIK